MLKTASGSAATRPRSGELTIYLEDDHGEIGRIAVTPGVVVHIPGGRSHTVRNESASDALAYAVFAPGAEMERFIRAAAALSAGGTPSTEDVIALAERHGIEFTGPVPAGPERENGCQARSPPERSRS